jgi:hypothetical protein
MRYTYLWIVLCIVVFPGCSRSPSVSFTAQKKGDQVEFHFGYHNVNGLLGMMVWEKDASSMLWSINLGYYRGDVLEYGVVPLKYKSFNGVDQSAKQNIPSDSLSPQTIPVGKEIMVRIHFQYDYLISACSSQQYYSFRINPDGSVINLGEVSDLSGIQFPVESNQDSKPKDPNSPPNN